MNILVLVLVKLRDWMSDIKRKFWRKINLIYVLLANDKLFNLLNFFVFFLFKYLPVCFLTVNHFLPYNLILN